MMTESEVFDEFDGKENAAEIARLKRALAQKEEEVAVLKKAAAYFARDSR